MGIPAPAMCAVLGSKTGRVPGSNPGPVGGVEPDQEEWNSPLLSVIARALQVNGLVAGGLENL
ncbi:hypothetical protein GCM10009634_55760 [Saccharothrix xinjiangensis]